ncbi:MAG: Flagellar hook-associated protein FlgK [Verrucomicrobiales bacterium]|nr:Flagellar hook-associated protein FlgK [Verrucomicrobiales bacterium]MDB6129062.1 Flagellar hook-associated protein FlgK [Verrucomicrobiales bacterium]
MLGLFGTLGLGTRSLQTQQQGTETAGHNLANVNNPAYSRQRLQVETSINVPSMIGPQGTGADAVGILQIRSSLVDRQIGNEASVRGSLDAQQAVLQTAQADLGQQIDRQSTSASSATDASSVGTQHGLAESLSSFFNSMKSLSASPTSLTERQAVLNNASGLAMQFGELSSRFDDLKNSINSSISDDVVTANTTLQSIAKLNKEILSTELSEHGAANDLKDLRQQKLEDLAKLVKADVGQDSNGNMTISVGGASLVEGSKVVNQLETFNDVSGKLMVREKGGASALTLTGGSLEGRITARDGTVADLQSNIDSLAKEVIKGINAIHSAGFSLSGTTGENFFTGTGAADIKVNQNLISSPGLIQASGVSDAVGDNQVALAMSQFGDQKLPGLKGQTVEQDYSGAVTLFGQSLATVNSQIANQDVVDQMLARQRDSISGVSVDEEMTDLIKYQKAFQASAKLISTVDEMLDTVINLKR